MIDVFKALGASCRGAAPGGRAMTAGLPAELPFAAGGGALLARVGQLRLLRLQKFARTHGKPVADDPQGPRNAVRDWFAVLMGFNRSRAFSSEGLPEFHKNKSLKRRIIQF
jgi:hypothetical protein